MCRGATDAPVRECHIRRKKKPLGVCVASGAGSGAAPAAAAPLADATALLIIGGLVAGGAGVGAYYGTQGGGTPTPIRKL